MQIQVHPTDDERWSWRRVDPGKGEDEDVVVAEAEEPFGTRGEAIVAAREVQGESFKPAEDGSVRPDTLVLMRPDGSVYGSLDPKGTPRSSDG